MDEGELLLFLVSGLFAAFYWGQWYWRNLAIQPLRPTHWSARLLLATPPLCLLFLGLLLRTAAARDVQTSVYFGLYLSLGAAWLGLVDHVARWLGLSARDDVFERANPAAAVSLAGLLLGSTLVQDVVRQPQSDLAHVLLRWQQARVALTSYGLWTGGPLAPLGVSPPSHFRQLWYRALVLAGLRRHSGGGFGALIPEPGGGGFG